MNELACFDYKHRKFLDLDQEIPVPSVLLEPKMKVFISWSGERSQAMATALREWFPLVLHYVDPWLSKADIKAGDRWSVEIAKELEACNFGIICITKENLNAPWILFEAGALAKSMQDGRVTPLLLDIDFKEITGPLAQFQATKVDQTGMRELVVGLNKIAASPVPEIQVQRLFGALWSDFEKQIAAIPKSTAPTKHSRPQGEILEELVSGVRNVEMRMRDLSDDSGISRRRRKRFAIHPTFLSEFAERFSFDRRDPIQLVIISSLVRNELPWLYELAAEVYRASNKGDGRRAERTRRQLLEALDLAEHMHLLEEFGVDPYIILKIRRALHSWKPFERPKADAQDIKPPVLPEEMPPQEIEQVKTEID